VLNPTSLQAGVTAPKYWKKPKIKFLRSVSLNMKYTSIEEKAKVMTCGARESLRSTLLSVST
jgi:hypothetical protein